MDTICLRCPNCDSPDFTFIGSKEYLEEFREDKRFVGRKGLSVFLKCSTCGNAFELHYHLVESN